MSGILFDGLHHGLKRVLDLRADQHGIGATNIAHRDTPGYHAKELDFSSALAEAVDSGNELELRRTNSRHLHTSGAAEVSAPLIEHLPDLGDTDGNTVNLERENARLTENALMTTAVSDGIGRRLAILKFAASDGR